jgi:hypothetical protein
MLLKEMLNYRRGGNFDRIRAYGITLAYSNGMSRIVTSSESPVSEFYKNITTKSKISGSRHFGSTRSHFSNSKFSHFR